MKAILVAAGEGTRCKPYSLQWSKIITPFMGKPLLYYHIDEFLKHDLKDIVIVCNKHNAQAIMDGVGKTYPKQNIHVAIQENQLGPSHAIACAADYFKNDEFVLFKYADSIHDSDLVQPVLACFEQHPADGVLTLREVQDPSRYGIARLENERVVEIVEKPDQPPSHLAVVGIGILRTSLFLQGLDNDQLYQGKKEVVPQQYILEQKGTVNHWIFGGERTDLGKPWDILLTQKLLAKRFGAKVYGNVDATASVDDTCYVGKHAIIGKNCVVRNYASVEGVVRDNTLIDGSVIMAKTTIGSKCAITNSVIGPFNTVGDGFTSRDSPVTTMFVRDKQEKVPLPKAGLFTGSHVTIRPHLYSAPGKVVYPHRDITTNITTDRILRAIIFDADNTIYNTRMVAKQADMAAMNALAKQCDTPAEKLYEEWKHIVRSVKDSVDPKKRTRMYSYRKLAIQFRIDHRIAYRAFLRKLTALLRPISGLKEFLETTKHLKKAIMSEDFDDIIRAKLMALGLSSEFHVVVTADKVGRMKPDKNYLQLVLSALKVTPPEVIVVGDDYDKDLSQAKELGITTICFGEDARADISIREYSELQKVVQEK